MIPVRSVFLQGSTVDVEKESCLRTPPSFCVKLDGCIEVAIKISFFVSCLDVTVAKPVKVNTKLSSFVILIIITYFIFCTCEIKQMFCIFSLTVNAESYTSRCRQNYHRYDGDGNDLFDKITRRLFIF